MIISLETIFQAKDFLIRSMSTDASLLFSPSQIALAALLSAASKQGLNIDKYGDWQRLCYFYAS